MPANAFKTLFLLLTLLATCTQCLLNEKKVSKYTPSNLGLRTSGISESAILIFGWVLACAGSGVNKVTDNFGADIKSEFSRRKIVEIVGNLLWGRYLNVTKSDGFVHSLWW